VRKHGDARLIDHGAEFVDGLRAATNGGWAFGRERFQQEIAAAMGRRVAPSPAGRKPKLRADDVQAMLL
jgi:hypothetical protein